MGRLFATRRCVHLLCRERPVVTTLFGRLYSRGESESRGLCSFSLTNNTAGMERPIKHLPRLKVPFFNRLGPGDKAQHSIQLRSIGSNVHEMTPEEKAKKFQRPKAQTTIDEEEVSKFSGLAALWWDEGGEFEALHSLNDLRIPLIRDALMSQKKLDQYDAAKPLEGFWILDVGSGGGILSEPLARLGASVIGLEASEENIKIAQAHLMHDPAIRDKIKYIHSTVEEIAETQAGKFDAVVASEVLEHVADANTFVSSACQLVRPGGSIFFTTLNKTWLAYTLGILVAENLLRLVSPGTHDWEKFVSPMDLQYMLDRNNFSTRLIHGMWYNPLSKRWSWSRDTSINYALHAVRAPVGEREDGNVWADENRREADSEGSSTSGDKK